MSSPRPRAAGLDPRLAPYVNAGLAHLQARRFADAAAALAPLAAAAPGEAELRRAYAEALLGAGDLVRAEAEARAVLAIDKRRPPAWATLANVLAAAGRSAEAEKALRQALTLDRRFSLAAVRLNQLLLQGGRAREAAQATAPLAAASREAGVLAAHAQALKAERRFEESLGFCERARDADPQGGIGEHNVASLLADLHRQEEALAAADRAFAAGLDMAATWLVRAHALQGLNRLDEAETAYVEALRREPRMTTAVTDLARLTWMRTGQAAVAVAVYDRALAAGASDPALFADKARLLEYAGQPQSALAALAPIAESGDVAVNITATQIAAPLDPERAARHAEAAFALRPQDPAVRLNLAEARLAQGRPDVAVGLVGEVLAVQPDNQGALGVQAVAWRLLDDPRYRELYDYAAFVGAYRIDTPPGWPDLDAFLADLGVALTALHTHETHPVGQSLRHGTQTGVDLLKSDDPAIRAAFAALDAPIRAHMAALGKGRDPVRRRARSGGYAYAGAWSVRLKPGGRHVDHIHPEGWLSSAFYIGLPPAVGAGGREGWIKFGEPGLPHGPRRLPAEHWVKPEPGKLVLFPSYMWHGTAPFSGEAPRLTMAFDLVPA